MTITSYDVTKLSTITKLTKDMALKLTFQKYIRPIKSIMIISTTTRMVQAENKLSPEIRNAIMKTTSSDKPKDSKASVHIDKYCSKYV